MKLVTELVIPCALSILKCMKLSICLLDMTVVSYYSNSLMTNQRSLINNFAGFVKVYDFTTARLCCQFKFKEFVTSVTFDPGTSQGVVGTSSDTLNVFK